MVQNVLDKQVEIEAPEEPEHDNANNSMERSTLVGVKKATKCTPFMAFMSFGLVIIGSLKTLSLKWSNQQISKNSVGANMYFNHPFLQAWGMFVGELLCMVLLLVKVCSHKVLAKRLAKSRQTDTVANESKAENKKKTFSAKKCWLMIPPTLFDLFDTVVLYLALSMTSAASFQMLSGAVVIFTGISNVCFLGRQLKWYHWMGMIVICSGLVIVGLGDALDPTPSPCFRRLNETNSTNDVQKSKSSQNGENGRKEIMKTSENQAEYELYPLQALCDNEIKQKGLNSELIGDLLVIFSQLTLSFHITYEEYVLSSYEITPLDLVAWQGVFGSVLMSLLLVLLGYIDTGNKELSHSPTPPWIAEDSIDGFIQLGNNASLLISFVISILSASFFNYACIYLTGKLSGCSMMVLDQIRTPIIWTVSLLLGWQHFKVLQPIGFLLLFAGMIMYYYREVSPIMYRTFFMIVNKFRP